MTDFRPGDRVWVDDDNLAAHREIMARATGTKPADNHRGVVEKTLAGLVYILFDDGIRAPYPTAETHLESDSE